MIFEQTNDTDYLYSDRPLHLYRGIKLTASNYQEYDFEGDIPLPDKSIINENGLKCVTDGNEFGIYMSSNPDMAIHYAKPELGSVERTKDSLLIGQERNAIGLPAIGLFMRINTRNIDIKEPYICPTLRGHYNNGFAGKEWISTEPIPARDFVYKEVMIGPDLLHDRKHIQNVRAENVKSVISDELDKRKKALTKLNDFLKDEPAGKLLLMNYRSCKESFQKMFVENCLEKTEFDLSTRSGLHELMLSQTNYMNGGITLKDVDKIARRISHITEDDVKNMSLKVRELIDAYMPEELQI